MHLKGTSMLQSLDKADLKQTGPWAATANAAAQSTLSATELVAKWDGGSGADVAGSTLLPRPSEVKGSIPAYVPGC